MLRMFYKRAALEEQAALKDALEANINNKKIDWDYLSENPAINELYFFTLFFTL
jgi:hypothetical protein